MLIWVLPPGHTFPAVPVKVGHKTSSSPTLPAVFFSDISRFLRPIPRFVLRAVAFPDGTGFSDYEGARLGLSYSQSLFGPAPAWIENVATGEVEAFNVEEESQ